ACWIRWAVCPTGWRAGPVLSASEAAAGRAQPGAGPQAALWNVVTVRGQHASQRNQRQPDERGRITRFDRLQQGDAAPLGLDAAGGGGDILAIHVALESGTRPLRS